MILIISNNDDVSTNDVIDWLRYYDAEFIRLSANTPIKVIDYWINNDGSEDAFLEVKNQRLLLSSIHSIWYRRSWLNFDQLHVVTGNSLLDKQLNEQLEVEYSHLCKHIDALLQRKMLNRSQDNNLSKIEILSLAKKLDIRIPETIITRNKKILTEFIRRHNQVITKNYSPGIFLRFNDFNLGHYTTIVTMKDVEQLPEEFLPTLFQELIEKSFELRVFYLNGEVFTSAIFSQNDEKTKIDFRNYNTDKPNRTPPFKLPEEIHCKIDKLMSSLRLNSGSIDLLIDKSGDFVFLEVNPIGQFAQVSYPCNYTIEKKIAQSIIQNKHERTTIGIDC